MNKKKVREPKDKLVHGQVRCERGFLIDVHILPICRKMWDADVETFYSCQGGASQIGVKTRKVYSFRAYIVVLKKDKKKALRLLKGLNPKADRPSGMGDPYQVAIRFDPPHLMIDPIKNY